MKLSNLPVVSHNFCSHTHTPAHNGSGFRRSVRIRSRPWIILMCWNAPSQTYHKWNYQPGSSSQAKQNKTDIMLIDWSCYRYAPLCDVRRSMGCECGRVPGGKTSWKNLAAKPKAAWEEVNDVSIFTTQFGCGVGEERSSSNSSTMSWSKFVLRPAIRTDIFCFITIISLQLVSWEDHCTVLGWLLDSTLQLNIPKLTA